MSDTFISMFKSSEVAKIRAAGTRVTLPEGWSPIAANTPADKAYVIEKGEVSVRAGGQEVARAGAGDIIGESAIINRTLRTASIVALTPLELIHLSAEALKKLDSDMPHFHDALEKVAAARVSAAHAAGVDPETGEAKD